MAYIKYWLLCVNQHSLHSPFLYSFYEEIIKDNERSKQVEIESLRVDYLKNDQDIQINDLGAGSRIKNSGKRKTRQIAKHSSTPARFSRLMFRLIAKMESETIVELGTSLGFNTLYMCRANPNAKIFTFEGAKEIAAIAQSNFDKLASKNIELIEGDIDNTLPSFLSLERSIDLAYIDANHRFEPTISYFNQILNCSTEKSIIVIDDIYWSKEMNRAWNKIKRDPRISLTLDLFEAGIVFLDPELPKTNLTLKF